MAKKPIDVTTLTHEAATRRNIPTAEFESVMREQDKSPVRLAYERRNRDLDPQLVWRGKDEQDWSDLVVQAPPLFIQEKVHPKVIIDDLKRETKARADAAAPAPDLFADFNGLPKDAAATDFYQHDQHWSNRMIVGDSLSVMASLAEREGLRGKVQCIYLDPPYGIKFNSNFQWSTTSRDVKDGAKDQITREPEQVRAFRDTWRDGIHSYLTYLRDRLTVARDLLTESGSIFVQIGDENVHRVRALMDEVFGEENFVAQIPFAKTSSSTGDFIGNSIDFVLWSCKRKDNLKFRKYLLAKKPGERGGTGYRSIRFSDGARRSMTREELSGSKGIPTGARIYFRDNLTSQSMGRQKGEGAASWFPVNLDGRVFRPSLSVRWKTNELGMSRLLKAGRIEASDNNIGYVRYLDDFAAYYIGDIWSDTLGQNQFGGDKIYVVQTALTVIQRCMMMTTDPGDLVLDPTCGSGSTAYIAEQYARRWITVDTSRVAIALARSRLMGARYPYYLLADSVEGHRKEAEVTRSVPKSSPTRNDLRHGFVYERVPHVMLSNIADNAEIDVIWEQAEAIIGPLRAELSTAAGLPKALEEWEISRERPKAWPTATETVLSHFWDARIARQKAIDDSIAAKAESEYLYYKPYSDPARVRVAGPFTVESVSPHRTLAVNWNDELVEMPGGAAGFAETGPGFPTDEAGPERDFAHMILENLKAAGVQQAAKEGRITFTALTGWPGRLICAEGNYMEGDVQRRAGIFVGPEFGTVSRPDLVAAAREAGDAGFDVLIACAFNYDAHSSEFERLGRVPVLKARMNPDLHMGGELKATGVGNLFVVFGEPDVKVEEAGDGLIRVKVFGVDVFKPQTGEVMSEGIGGIALWMLDTDYNEESFFVRHAYFLGANDPYKALKTTLKAEIDEEAWSTLYSDVSRPFSRPKSGRIAVKVINHLGDEVMKVFAVE